MPYLVEILLVLAPFLLFALWRRLSPGPVVPAAAVWLLLAGVICGMAGAVWYGFSVSLEPGTVYVPARLGPDGRVLPSGAEPRP
ncbi:hypothetical protein JMJ55_03035 [Belnapia sp. T6]|uniref:Uncharacterized protein n=1 Tax=Belnapia mucosa TaxID=2804532 RepID=A0ABS1V1V4_9PROT|nr:hypothetical protein [Belnapia mucosa]MBL6454283.1 hypothetical protein [Belnapia mucosa]